MTATMMQPSTSTKRIAVFDQALIPENSLNLLLRELAGERSLAKYFFTRQALITVARLRLHSAKHHPCWAFLCAWTKADLAGTIAAWVSSNRQVLAPIKWHINEENEIMATTVSPRLLVGILLSWLGSQVERFIGCDPEWRGDRFISELIEGERIGQTKTEQVRAHFDLLSGFTHVPPTVTTR